MRWIVIFWVLFLSYLECHGEGEFCSSGLCLPSGYDKGALPGNIPLKVKLTFNIFDVLDVSDKNFRVSLAVEVGMIWEDTRVIVPDNFSRLSFTGIDNELSENIWVPQLFINGLTQFDSMKVFNREQAGLYLTHDNKFYYAQSVKMSTLCKMRFNWFPMDIHSCSVSMTSADLPLDQMVFEDPFFRTGGDDMYSIHDFSVEYLDFDDNDKIQYWDLSQKNYSVTGFKMNLKRHALKYFNAYYLPSFIFVMCSWTSFVIPPSLLEGRLGLLVTLFLVLINIYNTVITQSPNVEGITALGAWMLVCIIYVFAAKACYSFMLFKGKFWMKMEREEWDFHWKKTDQILLYIFASSFMMFTMFYWITCLV